MTLQPDMATAVQERELSPCPTVTCSGAGVVHVTGLAVVFTSGDELGYPTGALDQDQT